LTDLVIINIGQLVTAPGSPRRGREMRELAIRSNVGVAVQDGLVSIVDDSRAVAGLATEGTTVVDANGSAVIPGLVDPHTHAVFAGDRRDEFARRVAGESYLDILAAGGGINSTVAATREASLIALRESFARRAARMLHHGATTIEVKSGYGLTAEHESLLLAAAQTDTTRVVKTFLGAHALPVEYSARRDDYVALVIEEMLPEAVTHGARFCDVFCEEGAFTLEESRVILTRAKEVGLGLKIHADQLTPMGGAELAVELGARSADHLGAVSPAGVEALAGSPTAAVLLPSSTLYVSGPSRAPARDLVDQGAIVAIGTDFNPGSSPVDSMPLMLSLASLVYGLTAEEAFTAATANSAYAIGVEGEAGCILPGFSADLLILDTDDYRDLGYRLGARLIGTVISGGRVVNSPASDGPL
jgi:imidazolonepropionase